MTIIQANKFYYLRGGAEKYLLDLCAYLESHGHTVAPFAMRHPQNLPSPYQTYFPSFVQTERVRFGPSAIKTFGRMMYSIEARRNMATLIAHAHPDLAHIHNIYNQLSPSILHALAEKRIPTVMTVHDHHLVSPQYNIWADGTGTNVARLGLVRGTLERFHKRSYAASFAQMAAFKFHRLLNIYKRGVTLWLTPSEYMKRQLVAGGFPADRIRVNHYGMDPAAMSPHYEHDGYFLFVGRLSEEKGAEMLVRLAQALPDIRFKVVGTGPEEKALHEAGHGCRNLEFIGFRSGDALMDLYRGATAVLLPSRVHEVFPLITLEAMGLGKPLIASNVGGVPEVVEDRITGFLVHPSDVRGWIEAVMRLAYDESLRLSLARASRLAAETTFHIKHHWQRTTDAYEEAVRLRAQM